MLAPKSVTWKTQKRKPCAAKEPKMNPKTMSQNINRGVIEKHRRQEMKKLYSRLASVLPLSAQEQLPVTALLDRSLSYVKYLKERVEQLKAKKDGLKEDMVMAAVEVNEKGSMLEANLVTGLNKGYILGEVLGILEQDGAQVLSANYSRLKDRILYSTTSQVLASKVGMETSRVHQRLKIISGVVSWPVKGGTLDLGQLQGGESNSRETVDLVELQKGESYSFCSPWMETFDLTQFQGGESYHYCPPSKETLDLGQLQGGEPYSFCSPFMETLDLGQFQVAKPYSFCLPSRQTLDLGKFHVGEPYSFSTPSGETLDLGQFQEGESYSLCWPLTETIDLGKLMI